MSQAAWLETQLNPPEDRTVTLARVREKYPQYATLDDDTLGSALARKYPQYAHLAAKVYAPGQGGDQVTDARAESPWKITEGYEARINKAPDPNKPFSNADWFGGIASTATAGAMHPFGIVNRFRTPAAAASGARPLQLPEYRKALTAGDGTTVGKSWTPAQGDFTGVSAEAQIAEEAAGVAKRLSEWSSRKKGKKYVDPVQGDEVKRSSPLQKSTRIEGEGDAARLVDVGDTGADSLLDRIAASMARIHSLGEKQKRVAAEAPVNTPPRTFESAPLTPEQGRRSILQSAGDILEGSQPSGPRTNPPGQIPGDMPGRRQKLGSPSRPIGGGSDAPEAVAQAGAAVRAAAPGTRSFGQAVGYFTNTILGRMERFGPEGAEVSRRVQKTLSDATRWYAANIDPVLAAVGQLNPRQRRLFFESADRGAIPGDAQVAQALDAYKRVFGSTGAIPTEAGRLGIMTRSGNRLEPFEALENFFPHEWTPKARDEMFRQGTQAYSHAVRHMVETGQARNLADAQAILRRSRMSDRKVGGLEFSRDLNLPGYIEDPLQAISMRGWKVAQRFAELQNYGKNADEIQGLIRAMEQTGRHQEARRLHGLFELATNPDPVGGSLRDVANKLMSWEAVTKLPLASVSNMTQPVWLALRTDMGTFAKALFQAARHPIQAKQTAQELGLLSDITVRQFMQEIAGGRGGKTKELLLSPYTRTEQFVRILGGNAGKIWSQKLQGRLVGGDVSPEFQRELGRLLLSPDEIRQAFASRSFSPDQLQRMAWAVADQVMFLPQSARRSEFMQSALGSATMQFKGFAINTGRLLHQSVIKEAQAGNVKPLALLLALTPLGVLVGEGVGDVRALISGGNRTTNLGQRLIEDLMFIGGLGIATDFVRALGAEGYDAVGRFLLGPGLSDLIQAGTTGTQAALGAVEQDAAKLEQNLLGLVRWGARQIPFLGGRASKALSATPKERRRQDWTLMDRLGLTQEARDMEEAEDAMTRRSRAIQWERTKKTIKGN